MTLGIWRHRYCCTTCNTDACIPKAGQARCYERLQCRNGVLNFGASCASTALLPGAGSSVICYKPERHRRLCTTAFLRLMSRASLGCRLQQGCSTACPSCGCALRNAASV